MIERGGNIISSHKRIWKSPIFSFHFIIFELFKFIICHHLYVYVIILSPFLSLSKIGKRKNSSTANVDLLKNVPVEILLNFENYFRTLQLGFWKFLSGIVFLHHYLHSIGLLFSKAHSIWPKPRAFNPNRKSMGTPTFYCVQKLTNCN